jgi:hypothetical protein
MIEWFIKYDPPVDPRQRSWCICFKDESGSYIYYHGYSTYKAIRSEFYGMKTATEEERAQGIKYRKGKYFLRFR